MGRRSGVIEITESEASTSAEGLPSVNRGELAGGSGAAVEPGSAGACYERAGLCAALVDSNSTRTESCRAIGPDPEVYMRGDGLKTVNHNR
jgi:hypothetical protein